MGTGVSRRIAALIATIGILASGLCFFCSRAAQVAAARRTLASTFSNFSNDSGKSVERGAGDIGDPQTAERAISEGLARFGRIDTLVNNAGIFIAKPFTTYAEADFAAMLATNLAGLFHITQRAIAQMVKQGSGHVINITASLVDQPTQTLPAVLAAVTKGGLNAASRSLAIEYATRGIRVNAVAPGVIKTPMHAPERLLAPLAFLSPRIIAAIVDGTAPADLTVTGLAKALPCSWIEQEQRVGL
jgi:NAD(P)-dependent dehydrogenase (short-subunit alcohol dehydrogenase family)